MNPLNTNDLLYLNQLPVINKVNNLKAELDSLRPLSKENEGRVMQKFRLDWNYNSNAIEGNSLDYGETVAFLMFGITAKGKPLKDYLDIRGHNQAIDYLLSLVKDKDRQLTESDIRTLHEMTLVEPYDTKAQTKEGIEVYRQIKLGQYKTTPNHVRTITGEIHYYATPEETPFLMAELIEWYRQATDFSTLDPVVIAAVFHHRFASIHPFDDGNGRISRLLMNLIFLYYNYPPVVIRDDKKNEYYLALSQADTGNISAFVELIGDNMLHSLDIYIKGAKGESIDEVLDLDKKLQLFKRELVARKDRVELNRSVETKSKISESSFKPFLKQFTIMASKFKELFLEYEDHLLEFMPNNKNRKMWGYSNVNLNGFMNDLTHFLYYDSLILSTNFNKFKLESNPFSLEIKLAFIFYELDYSLFYKVSMSKEIEDLVIPAYGQWLPPAVLTKYYHQTISEEEINVIITKIGNNLFDFIQELDQDSTSKDLKLDASKLINYWEEFLDEYYLFGLETIESRALSVVSVKNYIITVHVPAISSVENQKLDLQEGFSSFLLRKEYTQVKPIVVIL